MHHARTQIDRSEKNLRSTFGHAPFRSSTLMTEDAAEILKFTPACGVPTDTLKKPTTEALDASLGITGVDFEDAIRAEHLPEEFDAAEKWPSLDAFGIRNQGHCGSCWAVSCASAITDRLAIQFGKKVALSAQPLVSCGGEGENSPLTGNPALSDVPSSYCASASSAGATGCVGNILEGGLLYMEKNGTVVEAISPYQSDSSSHVPSCKTLCESLLDYPEVVKAGAHVLKTKGKIDLTHPSSNLSQNIVKIKEEIVTNGPVQGAFTVFNSFITFFRQNPTGIYRNDPDHVAGGHAVKIVGWGTDEVSGDQYWKVENSWGHEWGDGGFFKMFMAKPNDLQREGRVFAYNAVAGFPNPSQAFLNFPFPELAPIHPHKKAHHHKRHHKKRRDHHKNRRDHHKKQNHGNKKHQKDETVLDLDDQKSSKHGSTSSKTTPHWVWYGIGGGVLIIIIIIVVVVVVKKHKKALGSDTSTTHPSTDPSTDPSTPPSSLQTTSSPRRNYG